MQPAEQGTVAAHLYGVAVRACWQLLFPCLLRILCTCRSLPVHLLCRRRSQRLLAGEAAALPIEARARWPLAGLTRPGTEVAA